MRANVLVNDLRLYVVEILRRKNKISLDILVRATIYSAIKYINLKLNSESKQQCVY